MKTDNKQNKIKRGKQLPAASASPQREKPRIPTSLKKIYSVVELIVIVLLLRAFVIEAYAVPTGSMEDTILPGDFLLVEKITYRFASPKPGDVVVFKFPKDPRIKFVKRCIAVAGETVEVKDKVLYVDGKKSLYQGSKHTETDTLPPLNYRGNIQDAWEKRQLSGTRFVRDNFGPVRVPKGYIFCMGDNRDNSYDSRYWGPVPLKNVAGRPNFIYFSTNIQMGIGKKKSYSFIDNILTMLRTLIEPWHIRFGRLLGIIQ